METEIIEEDEIFYAICPTKNCHTIGGFSLPLEVIEKNEEYYCQECGIESNLNEWKKSTRKEMLKQFDLREKSKSVKKGKHPTDKNMIKAFSKNIKKLEKLKIKIEKDNQNG